MNPSALSPSRALIVVPTYNEEGNIANLLGQVLSRLPWVHVLFVDDNSRDRTRALIREQQQYGRAIFMLERPGKLGLGSAYVDGFRWGLERGYEQLVQMDADLSHNPDYLEGMLAKGRDYDLVIGSRYISGGGVVDWALSRRLLSRFGSLYARTILGLTMRDLTGGFNCWRAAALRKIGLGHVRSEGYSFQIELKYRAARAGCSICEHPIVFKDREVGVSKMTVKICVEAFYRVLAMKALPR